MDIFFDNPDDPPQPPEKMAIRKISADPYEDGRRVAVNIEITPFQRAPNLEITITDDEGRAASTLSVVEANEKDMSFTMHLRGEHTAGSYNLKVDLFYADLSAIDDPDASLKDFSMERQAPIATETVDFTLTL